jgi:hypothetical protein
VRLAALSSVEAERTLAVAAMHSEGDRMGGFEGKGGTHVNRTLVVISITPPTPAEFG